MYAVEYWAPDGQFVDWYVAGETKFGVALNHAFQDVYGIAGLEGRVSFPHNSAIMITELSREDDGREPGVYLTRTYVFVSTGWQLFGICPVQAARHE